MRRVGGVETVGEGCGEVGSMEREETGKCAGSYIGLGILVWPRE